MMSRFDNNSGQTTSLLDLLDHVLDKGLVVAGDIRVSLANVELLTIKIRLLVCSVDKAKEIGMDWWRDDKFIGDSNSNGTRELEDRIRILETQLLGPRNSETSESTEPGEDESDDGPGQPPVDGVKTQSENDRSNE